MISWIHESIKAVLFFLKFALFIVASYLLLLSLLWLLKQPVFIGLRQGSAVAFEVLAQMETAVKILGGLILSTSLLRFLDRYFLRGWIIRRLSLISGTSFSVLRLFTFPFIHKDNAHLAGNLPLLLLFAAFAVFLLPSITLIIVILMIFLVQGVGVWVFGGKNVPHGGASGLVLGLFSFDVSHGLFAGSWITAVALIMLLLFGRRMFKILANRNPDISVAGHVWGFLGGIFAAILISPFGFLAAY
jgi:membrane associated rhomboid family serine protease